MSDILQIMKYKYFSRYEINIIIYYRRHHDHIRSDSELMIEYLQKYTHIFVAIHSFWKFIFYY